MIAGNWKMHKTVSEAVELAEDIVMETNGTLNEVVIFPPFTALETVADAIDGKHVATAHRICIGKTRVPSPALFPVR